MMKKGTVIQTFTLALCALLTVGACAARAQEPPPVPPPVTPPVTPPPSSDPVQPPTGQPPTTPVQAPVPATQDPPPPPTPTGAPAAAPAAAASMPSRVELSDAELRRRRDAIFLVEGLLVNTVRLAATRTQTQIQQAVPDLSVTLFANVPPQANGFHLDDYGVVFNVIIPEYKPGAVNIVSMLTPQRPETLAQPTAASGPPSRDVALNPSAMYVEAVRDGLIDSMLKFGQSLELRPTEWLAIAARSAEGLYTGPVSEPSVLILRVKGSDLNDFLAGRLSRADVEQRVQVKPFSGRR